MPLSEHEERVLAEIERRLVEDDPRFVARAERRGRVAGSSRIPSRTRLFLGIFGTIIGILCVALLTIHVAFGIVGFLLLLGSLTLVVSVLRHRRVPNVEVLEADSRQD